MWLKLQRRRLRYKQGIPQVAKLALGSNSEENGSSKHGQEGGGLEEKRLLCMHSAISEVLSEECVLIDDLDVDQASFIPSLSILANQKFDLELAVWHYRATGKKPFVGHLDVQT